MTDLMRARGLMEGIAVGNLLGIPYEGWPKERIAEVQPDGVREMMASSGYPDDDDLALAVVIAKAASNGPLDIDDLGQRFWTWGEVNGAGMGGLTRRVLLLYGGDAPQRLARQRAAGEARPARGLPIREASKLGWDGFHAGNGAVMRCAPLAIRWVGDPDRLVRESVVSAVPTHWDPRCGWSCALANLATADALRGDIRASDALLDSARHGLQEAMTVLEPYGYRPEPPDSVVEAVRTAESCARIEDLALGTGNIGFTLLTLQAVLFAYWRAEDFESCLACVVGEGGDTDTNGAPVGALLGARFGLDAIPERWRRRVAAIRAERVPMQWYADQLVQAASS